MILSSQTYGPAFHVGKIRQAGFSRRIPQGTCPCGSRSQRAPRSGCAQGSRTHIQARTMADAMPKQRHTKESIVQTLQNVSSRLGRTVLSKKDVAAHVALSAINYHFGNLGNALKAAGLSCNKPGSTDGILRTRLTDDELFASLLRVEQLIGRAPNMSEYRGNGGEYSRVPYSRRFGSWDLVLQHYAKWKADRGIASAAANRPFAEPGSDNGLAAQPAVEASDTRSQNRRPHGPRKAPQLFGAPIDFRGLRHAPINEQGVVYLFGMVSRELGFSVEALQQGFPDCEGKYLHDKGRQLWAKARIEFEFRASNFREHCHDENGCDVIVCWENDWPDCPLRVVELKSEIMRLPSR